MHGRFPTEASPRSGVSPMAYRVIPVEPFDYVVFGGTGDLARRKLLPALFHRLKDGQIPDDSRIIATSRRQMSDDAFRAWAREALTDHLDDGTDGGDLDLFLGMLAYVPVDAASDAGWDRLRDVLASGANKVRAFYLAVSPDLFDDICGRIGAHGLVTQNSRVVIEKPVGHDLESARAVNDAVGRVFSESQIFRIDHYLGKETVQNLMALRFANVLYEPLWNAANIDHVQISIAETVGLEGRGD